MAKRSLAQKRQKTLQIIAGLWLKGGRPMDLENAVADSAAELDTIREGGGRPTAARLLEHQDLVDALNYLEAANERSRGELGTC